MKHISSILLSLLLFVSITIYGQAPQGRTSATVVADVLAQLPAQTPQQYNQLFNDLVSTGEEGLLELIGRMNPAGTKSNEAVEYAVSGWTHFIGNNKAQCGTAASAFEKALRRPIDKSVKAFVIRQFRKIATDENVAILSEFLGDESLADPASRALVSIGTEKAKAALVKSLTEAATEPIRLAMVNAIAQTDHLPSAEPILLKLLNENPSKKMQRSILNALAAIGTKASVEPLRMAAETAGYAYGKENGVASYLELLNRLQASEPQIVEKAAKKLQATAVKANRSDLKVAAAKLLLSQPKAKPADLLKEAIKTGDLTYLSGLLHAFPFENDAKSTDLILKTLKKSSLPEVVSVLTYWAGNHKMDPAVPLITNHLNHSDATVRKAAVRSLVQLGGTQALPALADLLKSDDVSTITLAKEALASFGGDISGALVSRFDDCTDEGKKAILSLIAQRKMDRQYDLVTRQIASGNPEVKVAAANALKEVVTDKNLPSLFSLLEQSEEGLVPAVQQAINAALSKLPAREQIGLVSEKMLGSTNKQRYFSALGNSGTDEALNLITKAYQSETGRNKEAAFNALTKWKSFHAIYPLLDIARNSSDSRELEKVVDAMRTTIAQSQETGTVKYLYLREAMQFAQNDRQKNELLKLLGATGQYQALLFAAPFMDQPALGEAAAQAAMQIAINNPSFAGKETTEILKKASATLSNPDADYQRQSIRKFLTENPTDGGFVSLFNGKDLTGWKGLVENPIKRAKMSPKELKTAQQKVDEAAVRDWKVEDGLIIFYGKGDNLCTDKQYGDFEMLIDWKLFEGAEPDAGIYLRGTPQVQIWDTARVNVGAQVGSGGLYNNKKNESKPLKVADRKVGEWNTFRIRMTGDRVSVWLNGELVTDNVMLENYWDREQPIFPIEQIELQAHGSKVAYRDIFIREIERPEPFKLSAEEEKEGFRILFDGTNMHQWTGNTKDYLLEEGNIVMHPSKSFGGNLYTQQEFDNFILRFEFMLTPGANNGLGIRTPMEGDAAYVGMELQILDNEAPVYSKLQKYQYHGSVYGVIPAKRGFLKPVGEWNYQEVVADGDRIKVILNGTTIVDGNIREASRNGTKTMDGKNHPGLLNKSGHIGFLGHGSVVKFRNIRIKSLK